MDVGSLGVHTPETRSRALRASPPRRSYATGEVERNVHARAEQLYTALHALQQNPRLST